MTRAAPQLPTGYAGCFAEPVGYVDFARFGPPSRDAARRLADAAAELSESADAVDRLAASAGEARRLAASLTGRGGEDAVVLTPNTSAGLFQIAFALNGGEVLVSPREFPANVYPWLQAARRGGASVRWLDTPDGRVTPAAVAEALDPRTTALAVSAVDFRTGYRADLAGLREVLGDRLLVVDAIQGFGSADLPWALADAVVTGGQKWLCAGWGSGFVSLSPRALARLNGSLSGWAGASEPDRFDGQMRAPDGSAVRFCMTNPDLCAAAALERGLHLVSEASVAAIANAIAARVEAMLDVIARHGGRLLVPLAAAELAGIVSFVVPGRSPEAVGAALRSCGLVVTARADHVRVSPHATTSFEAVERLDAGLRLLTG